MTRTHTKTIEHAVAELQRLPASDQEAIGRQMLQHIEKLRDLRDDIDQGIQSLNADQGEELDQTAIAEVIAEAHRRYERS